MTLSEITDADIEAAEKLLGFQFDTPRRGFLKRMDALDVQSCAGSGKTTLLVAKLDILARKWPSRSQGICVLSHTNVAKDEIQKRLGRRVSGIKLLSHPHFIGTIHEFVNRFLALPCLRSEKYSFKFINDDFFAERAKSLGASRAYIAPRTYYQKRRDDFTDVISRITLRYDGTEFSIVSMSGNKNILPSATSDTYKRLFQLKEKLMNEGVWRFDDMFAIAKAFLSDNPQLISIIQHRFPLLMIDETQDTQTQQLELLEQIFPHEKCLVQRLGDANQAIYFSTGAVNDTSFPRDKDEALDLNTTHRFGQWIANQASTTTVVKQQIQSQSDNRCYAHTIFLYDEQSKHQVLPAFADLISQYQWTEKCNAHAAGAISKDADALNIGDYWDGYDRSIRSKSATPTSLIGFARLARALHQTDGHLHNAIPKLRDGVVRLAKEMGVEIKDTALTWNRLCELYQDKPKTLTKLNLWIYNMATDSDWNSQPKWQSKATRIKLILAIAGGSCLEGVVFCDWQASPLAQASSATSSKINVFEHKGIEIQVGTIHSVKGETHDATLVLETKWYDLDIEKALDWLIGSKETPPTQQRQKERFKRLHVAMTRPRHLLCLAINVSHICPDIQSSLQNRGWQIQNLTNQD